MATPRFDIIGQAISDASRTRMLCELMDGRAFTNKELASAAGVTAQTATSHLRVLRDAELVIAEKRGRCVYHRLASAEVAQVLEQLAAIAPRDSLYRAQKRKAGGLSGLRSCYDHLAGPVAVEITQSLIARGSLTDEAGAFHVQHCQVWSALGVDLTNAPQNTRQPLARPCLDWTERRLHIAGPVARQMLDHGLARDWFRRSTEARHLEVTPSGRRALLKILELDVDLLLQDPSHAKASCVGA